MAFPKWSQLVENPATRLALAPRTAIICLRFSNNHARASYLLSKVIPDIEEVLPLAAFLILMAISRRVAIPNPVYKTGDESER